MENLHIEDTKSSPYILCDFKKNLISMKGRSYPEDVVGFYSPLFEWITKYLEQLTKKTVVKMELTYINTSSTKAIMTFFDMLDEAHQNGKDITVNWYHDPENEVAQECGEEFKEDLELPFNIISGGAPADNE
ncbi:MAG: DUF1987 domain-containing protein [bacterium]|nr:DUF1987 domain-containing protein [bacterium]